MRGKTSLIFAFCVDCPYEERLNAYKSEDRPDLVDARADLNLALTQGHYSLVHCNMTLLTNLEYNPFKLCKAQNHNAFLKLSLHL